MNDLRLPRVLRLLPCAALLPFTLAQIQPEWRAVAPGTAAGCRVVYDEARDRFVAVVPTSIEPVTLEWSGSEWRLRDVARSLPYRYGFSLAYDSARHRTVLFGGTDRVQPTADVFEYDGVAWVQRAVTGAQPTPRAFAACTYVPSRGVMIYGTGLQPPSDAWLWNGTTWTHLPLPGLPAFSNTSMAFDAATGRVVVQHGLNGYTTDLRTWTPIALPAPHPLDATMCADRSTGVVRMISGQDGKMWDWTGSRWQTHGAVPPPISFPGMASDLAGNVLLYGGATLQQQSPYDAIPRGDTYRFTAAGGWQQLASGGPAPTGAYLTAFDLQRQRTVVAPLTTADVLDVSEWDGRRWHTIPAPHPPSRQGMAMCFDMTTGTTMLFGGMELTPGITPFDDQYAWNGAQWQQRFVPRPTARYGHAMCCDLARSVVVLFGGQVASGPLVTSPANDTWEFNGAVWRRVRLGGPPARSHHAMAYDLARTRTVLFGGKNTQVLGDTWEWNGATWTQVFPAVSPFARHSCSCEYDISRGRVQLAGGTSSLGNNSSALRNLDHYEFDGSTWRQLSTNPPIDAFSVGRLAVHGDQHLQFNLDSVWLSSPTVAQATAIGHGCGASTLPALLAFGTPELGSNDFALEVHHCRPLQPVLLAVGAGSVVTSLGGGCTAYLPTLDLQRIAQLDGDGRATFVVPVPPTAALLGLEATAQAATLDPPAPLGIALTNGMALRIGN